MNDNEELRQKIQYSYVEPQIPKKRVEHIIFTILCFLLTLSIWALAVALIFLSSQKTKITMDNFYQYFHDYPIKKEVKKFLICIIIILYFFYIILEMYSSTFSFLRRKDINKKHIKEQFEFFFNSRPTYIFRSSSKVNDINHNNFQKFKYYSCRDISGLFILNVDKKNFNKKIYLLLELDKNIRFAIDGSKTDYEKEKQKFIQRNLNDNNDDKCIEDIFIKDLKKYYMIKIKTNGSAMANCFWFVIFTFLTFAEFYKLYLNNICVYQHFTLRKVVSTRNNLGEDHFYEVYNPQIKINTNIYNNEPKLFIFRSQHRINYSNNNIINNEFEFKENRANSEETNLGAPVGASHNKNINEYQKKKIKEKKINRNEEQKNQSIQ
jgi:hypothetical protein